MPRFWTAMLAAFVLLAGCLGSSAVRPQGSHGTSSGNFLVTSQEFFAGYPATVNLSNVAAALVGMGYKIASQSASSVSAQSSPCRQDECTTFYVATPLRGNATGVQVGFANSGQQAYSTQSDAEAESARLCRNLEPQAENVLASLEDKIAVRHQGALVCVGSAVTPP